VEDVGVTGKSRNLDLLRENGTVLTKVKNYQRKSLAKKAWMNIARPEEEMDQRV